MNFNPYGIIPFDHKYANNQFVNYKNIFYNLNESFQYSKFPFQYAYGSKSCLIT